MFRIFSFVCISITIFLNGCQSNESKELTGESQPFPTVIDTNNVSSFYHHYYKSDMDNRYLHDGSYFFNYIGKYQDTIYSGFISFGGFDSKEPKKIKLNAYGKMLLAVQKYYVPYGEEREYEGINKHLEIRVDTSSKLTGFYPVMLTNTSSDTCFIGSNNQIPLLMEAKDKKGQWNPIQNTYTVGCGTGVGHIFLPPKHIVITLAPIFKGDYKTQLRLKCGKNYSNTFTGKIYYRQFKRTR